MSAPPFSSSPDALRSAQTHPPPPPPSRGLRIVARVVLWTLLGILGLHTVLPAPAAPRAAGSSSAPGESSDPPRPRSQRYAVDQLAMATAAAFLREYLTVDRRREDRPGRLRRYLARGVDLEDAVTVEPGVSQSTDLVLPAGVRSTRGGVQVTVIAHLLRTAEGPAQDGGTVAFVVPMIPGSRGIAVGGLPRPAALPVDPALASRPVALPAAQARAAAAAAGRAVAAVLDGDWDTLAKLGGGSAPVVRPFPDGWRPVGIATIRPAGPPGAPTAEVLVRARPPVAGVEYLVPVVVSLRSGTGAPAIREVDAGGTP
ncbi:MAG TPA: hypothetical protein VFA45_02235 [Actinomycetes bacterium]|nr:hypothetical protein [Actinomycetes bacterium]